MSEQDYYDKQARDGYRDGINDDWVKEDGVDCVVCPSCAFAFDALHADGTGVYACPLCAEDALRNAVLAFLAHPLIRACVSMNAVQFPDLLDDYERARDALAVGSEETR